MAVTYDRFNKVFFSLNDNIRWFDRKGIMHLKNGLIATITLSTCGNHKEYEKYVVEIKNKDKGTIDTHSFEFKTYFHKTAHDCYSGFKIIEHCCEDTGIARWYSDKPEKKEYEKMASEIIDYIKEYEAM